MRRNPRAGGGGSVRPRQQPPNLGKPNVDPGFNKGGFQQLPGRPLASNFPKGPPDLNGDARGGGYGGQFKGRDWSRGGGGPQPGGMPGQGGFDYDAFNAWQDPNIGGQQPGPIQQGWGGFLNSQDSMLKTKMNNYLNQFSTGGDRERVMNQMGYFNGGNPYTPQGMGINKRSNEGWRQEIMAGSAPGSTWQVMDPGGAGYNGIMTGGAGTQSQYTPLGQPQAGRTRRTRTFGQVGY